MYQSFCLSSVAKSESVSLSKSPMAGPVSTVPHDIPSSATRVVLVSASEFWMESLEMDIRF